MNILFKNLKNIKKTREWRIFNVVQWISSDAPIARCFPAFALARGYSGPKNERFLAYCISKVGFFQVDTNKCPTEAEKKLFATTVPDRNIEHRYNDFMDFKERACTGG